MVAKLSDRTDRQWSAEHRLATAELAYGSPQGTVCDLGTDCVTLDCQPRSDTGGDGAVLTDEKKKRWGKFDPNTQNQNEAQETAGRTVPPCDPSLMVKTKPHNPPPGERTPGLRTSSLHGDVSIRSLSRKEPAEERV